VLDGHGYGRGYGRGNAGNADPYQQSNLIASISARGREPTLLQ
ncbi:MAG: hypothetical protein ACJATP_001219, partial [Candidatus Azotimanducaceae bacterium]